MLMEGCTNGDKDILRTFCLHALKVGLADKHAGRGDRIILNSLLLNFYEIQILAPGHSLVFLETGHQAETSRHVRNAEGVKGAPVRSHYLTRRHTQRK